MKNTTDFRETHFYPAQFGWRRIWHTLVKLVISVIVLVALYKQFLR